MVLLYLLEDTRLSWSSLCDNRHTTKDWLCFAVSAVVPPSKRTRRQDTFSGVVFRVLPPSPLQSVHDRWLYWRHPLHEATHTLDGHSPFKKPKCSPNPTCSPQTRYGLRIHRRAAAGHVPRSLHRVHLYDVHMLHWPRLVMPVPY